MATDSNTTLTCGDQAQLKTVTLCQTLSCGLISHMCRNESWWSKLAVFDREAVFLELNNIGICKRKSDNTVHSARKRLLLRMRKAEGPMYIFTSHSGHLGAYLELFSDSNSYIGGQDPSIGLMLTLSPLWSAIRLLETHHS